MYMSCRANIRSLEELVELLEFVTEETGSDVFRWGSEACGGHKPDVIIIIIVIIIVMIRYDMCFYRLLSRLHDDLQT
jgi:hypothetical protein